MSGPYQIWYTLAIALGIGLLIGAERERRKGSGSQRAPAGIRTFALTSLLGALGITLGGAMLLAVAGAVLSTLATFVQMGAVLAVTSAATLRALWVPLICAGATAAAYGALLTLRTLRHAVPTAIDSGRAFSLKTALLFSMTICAVLVASAALDAWLGRAGIIASAALAGFADTHSAAASVASLVAAGKLAPDEAVIPILAGLTTNTLTKVAVALTSGAPRFAAQIIPGLLLAIAAAWLGAVLGG